jgi:hypothetical protein
VSFGTNVVKGVTSGFAAGDFDSMLGALSSGGMAAKAASHGSAIGLAFAGGITVAAAAGIVDLGVKVGETFEQINRDITLHTAASGKALEDLKSTAASMVGELDSSTAHLGSDLATLATRLQAPGEAVKSLAGHVEMLRDRMGNFDVGALAGAFHNMGVTAAGADDTLASLAQTVQRTDIPMSELATSLAANSELFKDLHLSTEQAGAMLGDLSAKGVPATTAIMGLQMGMKTAKDQGEDFNTFINRIADSLQYYKRTGNEVAAEDLSLAVGGPRKWTDELASIQALQAARSSSYAGNAADLTKLGEDTETLAGKWEKVKNKIDSALAPPGLTVTDEIKQKMDGLISFIDAHSTDLRNLFETAVDAIEQVVTGLGQVSAFLGAHPALIDAVALAFGTWEAIKGVNFVLTGLESVVAWLGTSATTAVTTGAAIDTAAAEAGTAVAAAAEVGDTAMLGLAATLGTVVADLLLVGTTAAEVLATGGDARGAQATPQNVSKGQALQKYSDSHGGSQGHEAWPDGTNEWLSGKGPMPKELAPYMQAPGAPVGAAGQPPAPGTGRFAPGQGPDVGGRAGPQLPGASAAPGGGDTGGPPGDLLTPADLDPAKKGPEGPRLPVAPEVPYGAGYGAPPGPGESAEQYSKQQEILEKRHAIDEAQARLNQLEQANNATADDMQKAKNELLHADSEYQKAALDQTKKHTGDMEQLGAKIDNDFGISKGLPGIAENLTKFLANLAFAPAFGAMAGAQAGLGHPGGEGLGGGKGLLGMAGLSGALGQQFTAGGGGGAAGGAPAGGRGSGLGGLLDHLTGSSSAAAPAPAGGPAAAGTPGAAGAAPAGANLDAWITAAESAAGVDASWTSGLKTLIGRESGGNPAAINLSDSNAMAGHPSQGLMQTIPGTFSAYHAPGTSESITDPVANIAAGIRYIQGRYGGIGGVQQANPNMPPKGYAAGGPAGGVSGPGPNDTIPAMLAPGEHVLTSSDVNAMGGQQAVYNFRAGLQAPGAIPPTSPAPGVGAPTPPTPPGGAPASQSAGAIGAPKGLGSGFSVTGGGLIGVAESIPSTVANAAIEAGAASAAAQYGGALEDILYFDDGGDTGGAGGTGGSGGAAGGGAGGGSPGGGAGAAAAGAVSGSSGGAGTGAGGGGSPGGSVVSAAIGIGIQEANEAISKGGQAAGAIVGGLQQTFGAQQFAGSQLAQNSWAGRIIGGIAGAQPQLPNMAGKGSGNNSPEGIPVQSPMSADALGAAPNIPGPPDPAVGPAPVAQAPAPPPASPALPSPSGAGGAGAESMYGAEPRPDDVIPSRSGAATPSSFNQGGSGGSSFGPAVHIENYNEADPNSAGQDIARHVEASYAAQSTPGAR